MYLSCFPIHHLRDKATEIPQCVISPKELHDPLVPRDVSLACALLHIAIAMVEYTLWGPSSLVEHPW